MSERKILVAISGCGCVSAVANDTPDLDQDEWLRKYAYCRIETMSPEEFERRYKVNGSWWDGMHCDRHRERSATP